MIDINLEIKKLIDYAINKDLISKRDSNYCINKLLETFKLHSYSAPYNYHYKEESVENILNRMNKWAVENKVIEDNSTEALDLFDTCIMSQLIQMPSIIEERFYERYEKSSTEATRYYYDLARHSNYIREKRIAKDIKWKYPTEYGTLDLTINLSKPEKDPKMISKLADKKSFKYPECLLCVENEGYEGRINYSARGNHRVIGLNLSREEWYMQYSPYVYYNEHCILVKAEHEPMQISRATFKRLLDFVKSFPHYFLGSNAGLPIVGGSILSHEHYQGGNYSFAIEKAKEIEHIKLNNNIEASILFWPMNVIRLKGKNIDDLADTAYKVLQEWRNYIDPSVDIYSHTDGEEHNTVTPIARCKKGVYELDIVLRNNKTTDERPYGIYHAKEEHHNIKKENIGLIEVMGLAVLPSRLKTELELLKTFILKRDIKSIIQHDDLKKHSKWAEDILSRNEINETNITEIIESEVGRVFLNVLKDAAVFKDDQQGLNAFKKCRNKLFYDLKN